MKNFFLIIMLLFIAVVSQAQSTVSKPPINNETYKTWESLKSFNISSDGKYAWYSYGVDGWSASQTFILCTTDGKYKREFSGGRSPVFTADSRYLIFGSSKGLAFFELGKDTVQYVKNSGSLSMPEKGNGRWLSYSLNGALVLKDMVSGIEKRYPSATGAWFNEQGTIFLVQTPAVLQMVSLADEKEKTILQVTTPVNSVTFDTTGTRIAFITSGSQGNVLRYYQPGMDSAAIHVTNGSAGIKKGFIIADEAPKFSSDGQYIFFKLIKEAVTSQLDSTLITDKVDVWHYGDKYLQSHQAILLPGIKNRSYTTVVPINRAKVTQLESADTTIGWVADNPGNYILVSNIVNDSESYWNKKHIANYQLVSLADGSRRFFLPNPRNVVSCALSPDEQFVTWYDKLKKHHFSYEVATGVIRNITQALKLPLNIDFEASIPAWVAGDKALLIYDRYDIWQVDPTNRRPPINITGDYGRSHRTTFRLIDNNPDQIVTDTLLLTALNRSTQYNGFWKAKLATSAAPNPCGNMGAYLYYAPAVHFSFNARPPIRAKNAKVYLVQRMSATAAPNLFATSDFHSFIPLSDLHPQKEYNWMTSELIRWKKPDGKEGQGILYKPENFDPGKKYPVIFHYYEERSNELFAFQKPALSAGALDIAWYVSNGYLVCVPDIIVASGLTGQSAINSVVSAAKYLSIFPWVDASKMGLQGHSFGGQETNYLITHSTLFAAAQESAGPSNLISSYGGLTSGEQSNAFQSEVNQNRLYTTPWQRPDIYVENSPVFRLDKVQTPLLMQHNKRDDVVPFAQALELFTGLRRLQKPVWMLQYDGQRHTITDNACKLDFTIRQQQFFDHYLKGKPAPVWMKEGIDFKDKGIKSGLALSGQ